MAELSKTLKRERKQKITQIMVCQYLKRKMVNEHYEY